MQNWKIKDGDEGGWESGDEGGDEVGGEVGDEVGGKVGDEGLMFESERLGGFGDWLIDGLMEKYWWL